MEITKIFPKQDFAFGKIMEDKATCKMFLEEVLEFKIRDIEYPERQLTLHPGIDTKGIRLDVYAQDDENTVYNVEMQTTNTRDIPKRSRYYQGAMDIELLKPGETYHSLNKTFIIFVCTFDLFEKGLMKYTFDERCREVKGLPLEDGTTKIFLNTRGKRYNVSKKLQDALRYLEDAILHDESMELARMMDQQFQKALGNEEWRRNVVTLQLKLQELEAEARRRGIEQGIKQGRHKGMEDAMISSIHNLMESLQLSEDQAMDALKIEPEKREHYRKLL